MCVFSQKKSIKEDAVPILWQIRSMQSIFISNSNYVCLSKKIKAGAVPNLYKIENRFNPYFKKLQVCSKNKINYSIINWNAFAVNYLNLGTAFVSIIKILRQNWFIKYVQSSNLEILKIVSIQIHKISTTASEQHNCLDWQSSSLNLCTSSGMMRCNATEIWFSSTIDVKLHRVRRDVKSKYVIRFFTSERYLTIWNHTIWDQFVATVRL